MHLSLLKTLVEKISFLFLDVISAKSRVSAVLFWIFSHLVSDKLSLFFAKWQMIDHEA